MGIIQNGYDQHGNAQDDLEFFICTHKASLPSKTQGGNRSRSTGCPGKYINCQGTASVVGQGKYLDSVPPNYKSFGICFL